MSDIDPDVRQEIDNRLDIIESQHNVRILFAVESGSRAWGFPSPDSDYDVRFVYVHKRDWYLSIDQRRDVIETPIEGVFDINGWDLKKALQLLLKPNPVLFEWLESPIYYRRDEAVVAALLTLADKTQHCVPATFHYLHLAKGQWRRFIGEREEVALKKYFYALRPALALRFLRMHPDKRPPMNIVAMRQTLALPKDVDQFIGRLIERKRITRELGRGPRIPALDNLIEEEMALALEAVDRAPAAKVGLLDDANTVFRGILASTWRL